MTRAAMLSLALTQRRLSHQYRAFALEDERAGNLDAHRRNKSEADRLARDARWHLQRARMLDAKPVIERKAA